MKVLTAAQLDGPNDFAWTEEGELLYFGTECEGTGYDDEGHGYGDRCGCWRSLIGATSGKGTTAMRVEDRAMTEAEHVTAIFEALPSGWEGWTHEDAEEQSRAVREIAELFDTGTILRRQRLSPTEDEWIEADRVGTAVPA
jgi:hypothetical protein